MFKDDKQLAIIGEFAVWNALCDLKCVKSVIDVREDKRFQEWDVDLLIEDEDRQFHGVEVKTDWKTYETGNVIYETESFGKVGCLERTKADYVAYFVPQSGNIYLCETNALRKCVKSGGYPAKPLAERNLGIIVPLGDLERFGVVKMMIQTPPLRIERKYT